MHCVICDGTVNVRPCTNCYKAVVCERDSCSRRHLEHAACIPPEDTTEVAVHADVTVDNQGVPSLLFTDGATHDGTMKGILSMLMIMQIIPFLIDRVQLVYIRFGGVTTSTQESYPYNFECEGPLRGVHFSNRVEYKVCLDGKERIPVTTINITAGAGGPVYEMNQGAPLSEGRNLLKVQMVVIPVEHTTPARQPSAGR